MTQQKMLFNSFPNKPWFLRVYSTSSFENKAISHFPSVFSTCLKSFLPLSTNLKLSSASSFSLEEARICRLGKDFKTKLER